MKIVFTGGGTAGHITPNIALIKKLSNETLYYIGSDGMEQDLLAPLIENGTVKEFCKISAYKLQRKFSWQNFLLPIRLLKSVKEAKKHLKKICPDVIFSKGGYVGLPVVIAGKRLGIPTVIHESDMSVGLSNKMSSHFADVYLSAFPCDKRAKQVGLIVREEILHGDKAKGLEIMGFDGSKPILLVTGGSLGAKRLNDAIEKNPQLARRFDIFVICGKNKQIKCDFARQTEFVKDMSDVFAATDVCLTRAGANTLSELTLAQVPFITVPLTKQSRGEQLQNAEWFAKNGCGMTLSEANLDEELNNAINAVYDNRTAIHAKQRAQKNLYGTDRVVEILESFRPQKSASAPKSITPIEDHKRKRTVSRLG